MAGRDLFSDDDPIADNDFMGMDDDEEELGVDYHEMAEYPSTGNSGNNQGVQEQAQEEKETGTGLPTKRKARIKKLPDSWLRKYPDTASVLITKKDGSHVLLVNR